MKKSEIQTALQVLVEIHEDKDHLIALKNGAALNRYFPRSRCRGRIDAIFDVYQRQNGHSWLPGSLKSLRDHQKF